MVPGFNTDFKYRGETYHVQTEDNGVGNPVVVTLLYHKGAILASRRTPYADLIGKPGFEQELMGLMKRQHKDLMRALLAGAYDKNGAAPAVAGGSGEHPADAAAAVAFTKPTPSAKPLPERVPATRLRVPPVANDTPVPSAASRTATAPAPAPAPTPATATLDEAIRHYLESCAATAAAAAN
jgi:hypothetical protein